MLTCVVQCSDHGRRGKGGGDQSEAGGVGGTAGTRFPRGIESTVLTKHCMWPKMYIQRWKTMESLIEKEIMNLEQNRLLLHWC